LVATFCRLARWEQDYQTYAPEPVPLSILIVTGRARIKRIRSLIDPIGAARKALPGIGKRDVRVRRLNQRSFTADIGSGAIEQHCANSSQ
jgi:hypothetical protein